MILLSSGFFWVDLAKGSDGVWRWRGGFEHPPGNYRFEHNDPPSEVVAWTLNYEIFPFANVSRARRFCQAPVT